MQSTTRLAPLVLAGAVLSGCAVGPDYEAPVLPTPDQFNTQQAVSARPAATVVDLRAWWDGFQDPLLSALIDRALSQNLDIAQASARVTVARAAFGSAEAALLPSFDASAQAARAHLSKETPLGRLLSATPNFNRNGNFFETDLGASWELDLFGGERRAREAARADYRASQAGAVAARISVAAQTADLYVSIRGLQSRLAIARQQLVTRQKLLSTVQLQLDKGVAAELQVRQVQGSLAQVEASIPELTLALDVSMNALDVLLGEQPGTNRQALSVAAAIPVAPAISPTGTPADLLRRRPDLIAAERRLAASNARIGVAVSGYYPKFSLGAAIGTATTVGGNLFESGANQAQGVLGLRWRLFDFGRVDAEIAAARGRNAEALAAYRQSVLRASEDVEDAFSALVERERQARSLALGEIALTRARASAYAAYKGGVVSLIEVLDADANLLSTRDAQAQAGARVALAAIASFRALGGGWDVPAEKS